MSVAKVTELTSSSSKSFEDAIESGLRRASRTLEGIQGAWVKEQKVVWTNDRISEFRVTMKVTFVLKD
jgi:flavin-binding protein dodecin